jgi:hypothetical protein
MEAVTDISNAVRIFITRQAVFGGKIELFADRVFLRTGIVRDRYEIVTG